MRAMLDQLMGTSRDGEPKNSTKFTDPKVCKSYLLGCCPNEILQSTRMDLGPCRKMHDVALRADYEAAIKEKDYFYDIDASEHLMTFISDCDRKTELAKRRLAETQEELSSEVAGKANKVHELAEQIGQKLARAEELGAEGLVEESMKLMEEVEDIRKQKATAEQEYRNSMPASSYQQQKLRVCEVCSAYLGIHDNDRRLADHFGGKLHLGFIKIREKLAELRKSIDQRHDERRKAREAELMERRERSRSRSRERHSRSGRRSRSRERDRRSRHRSRSRSRSRDRGDRGGRRHRDEREGERRRRDEPRGERRRHRDRHSRDRDSSEGGDH